MSDGHILQLDLEVFVTKAFNGLPLESRKSIP